MIKAIETQYNGYRFRSRLEARWAVFFDALGIKYEYEKEGFDLGKAGWYLPDFYLPSQKTWIEIKAFHQKDPGTYQKCFALSQSAESHRVILICGNPWPKRYLMIILPTPTELHNRHNNWCPTGFSWQFGIGRKNNNELWVIDNDAAICLNPITQDGRHPLIGNQFEPLKSAYKAARQARFEHGETPNTSTI